jgi:hypothetical protein
MNRLPEKLTDVIFFVWRTLNAPSPDVAEVIMTAMGRLSLRKYSSRIIFFFSPKSKSKNYGRFKVDELIRFVSQQELAGCGGKSNEVFIFYAENSPIFLQIKV